MHLKRVAREQVDNSNINTRINSLKEKAKDDFRKFKEAKQKKSQEQEEERKRQIEEDYMGQTVSSLDYSGIQQKLSSIKEKLTHQNSKDSETTEQLDLFETKEV